MALNNKNMDDNKNMNLILTMAGKYSRFKDEGFKIPKFLLPWGDRSILSEILKEMHSHFKNVYLIANKNDEDFIIHVENIMNTYNIDLENIILIQDTKSQSETLYKGLELIKNIKGPIVVHNIDTILYNRDYKEIESSLLKNEGFVDIFNSNNPKYSYVMLKDKKIIEIIEKTLISDIATSGMYGFSSAEIFKKYYVNGYISNVYKKMIIDNLSIVTGTNYNESNTIVLGTPNEYMNLSKLKLTTRE